MSGIAGYLRRDGGSPESSHIEAMTTAIRHRGPDGMSTVCCGPVAFGHTMLWTTPESLHETLPLVRNSNLAITADARIDNREELIAELGLSGPPGDITDSELILEAYRKWEEDCPAKLVGDFAFAIWDGRKQQLLCARDPMGIKCLYYYAGPSLFAFGTEIKSLFRLPGVPQRLNELRVLDFLANIFDDRAITFYKDISRLPAASTLLVDRTRLKIVTHWSLDPKKELNLASDDEYTEAFRDSFVKAVKARTRSAFPIGSALSGGLDSSSIACVAREGSGHGPLHTFSLVFPSLPTQVLRHIDERKYMDDVLNLGGFQPHFVRGDNLSPMSDVAQVHRHLDEAYFEGNLYLNWAMYSAAKDTGVRVFLDGLDGDTTVSHGFEGLADLVTGFRWMKLTSELRLLSSNLSIPPKFAFREYCVKPFCPTWVYTAWRKLHGRPPDAGALQTFMNEQFKQRLRLDDRLKALIVTKRSCTRTAREKHWEMLTFPLYAHALEVADKSSAAFQVEARYPFFDRRLIELCLALPATQKLGHGWSRYILRRAMTGYVPESVQWRPSKANLSPNFYTQLLEKDRPLLDGIIVDRPSPLEPYVDMNLIRKAYADYNANPLGRHSDSLNIFGAVNLGLWLQTAGVRP